MQKVWGKVWQCVLQLMSNTVESSKVGYPFPSFLLWLFLLLFWSFFHFSNSTLQRKLLPSLCQPVTGILFALCAFFLIGPWKTVLFPGKWSALSSTVLHTFYMQVLDGTLAH